MYITCLISYKKFFHLVISNWLIISTVRYGISRYRISHLYVQHLTSSHEICAGRKPLPLIGWDAQDFFPRDYLKSSCAVDQIGSYRANCGRKKRKDAGSKPCLVKDLWDFDYLVNGTLPYRMVLYAVPYAKNLRIWIRAGI